jgi:hypothetical protein
MTIRHFDLVKTQWSIYWINNRDGKMQEPVVGGFDGDIGLFYGPDTDEGRPIKVVFQWTKLGPNAARWQQAFSYDDGKTWEVNWVNDSRARASSRTRPPRPAPSSRRAWRGCRSR